ncbi:hypothetical protein T484DRAFT_1809809, partial [Baffinella frigidus]
MLYIFLGGQILVSFQGVSGWFNASSLFEYYPPPKVRGVSPNIGLRAGGASVTVFAQGFYDKPEIKCRIGEVESDGVVSDGIYTHIPESVVHRFPNADSAVVCMAPAALCTPLPCSVPVKVSINGREEEFHPDDPPQFYWHDPIAAVGMEPTAGPASGGTLVDLT